MWDGQIFHPGYYSAHWKVQMVPIILPIAEEAPWGNHCSKIPVELFLGLLLICFVMKVAGNSDSHLLSDQITVSNQSIVSSMKMSSRRVCIKPKEVFHVAITAQPLSPATPQLQLLDKPEFN